MLSPLVLICLATSVAAQNFVTVGPSADCDYDTTVGAGHLQTALMAGNTELRLVRDVEYLGAIGTTLSTDKRIVGGYASCASAAAGDPPQTGARSAMRPALGQPILVQAVAHPDRVHALQLQNLDLLAFPAVPGVFGLGLAINGLATVRLENSRLSGFRWSGFGGGAVVVQGTLELVDSAVSDNQSRRGGGIYCSTGTVRMLGQSQVSNNHAHDDSGLEGHGGGIALDRCELVVESRNDFTLDDLELSGINANQASGSGGGIHAVASLITLLGGPNCSVGPDGCNPGVVVLSGNEADSNGGGLSLHDTSHMTADFFLIVSNVAGERGGGINAESASTINLGQSAPLLPGILRQNCPELVLCHGVFRNRSGGNGVLAWGGGFALQNAELTATNFILLDNSSDLGTQAYANGDSTMLLHQSWIRDQVDWFGLGNQLSVLLNGGSSGKFRQSTFESDLPNTALIAATDEASLLLERSLVLHRHAEAQAIAITGLTARSGHCNALLGETTADDLGAIEVVAADLMAYVLPIPSRGGALEDRCPPPASANWPTDLRGMPRMALGDEGNPATPLDIGAFEADQTSIFEAGFETLNGSVGVSANLGSKTAATLQRVRRSTQTRK